MASTATKVTGGVTAAAVAVVAALVTTSGPKTGLVQLCTGPDADKAVTDGSYSATCQRAWDSPGANDYVLSGTKPESKWGSPDYRWRKYSSLRLTDTVEMCYAKIEPGPFSPPSRPVVDANCEDPCGCNDKHKGPVVVASQKGLLTSNGGLFSWLPPTNNTDGSDIAQPVTYKLYRVTKKTENGVDVVDKTKPVKELFSQEGQENFRILAGEPIGEQCYAMTATTKDGVSDYTSVVCKVMKLGAPTSVGVESPTASGVE